MKALVKAGTPACAIVGKAWDLHVTEILKTDLDENLSMITDSIEYLKAMGKEVLFDANIFLTAIKIIPATRPKL